jgi:hypothetical protein
MDVYVLEVAVVMIAEALELVGINEDVWDAKMLDKSRVDVLETSYAVEVDDADVVLKLPVLNSKLLNLVALVSVLDITDIVAKPPADDKVLDLVVLASIVDVPVVVAKLPGDDKLLDLAVLAAILDGAGVVAKVLVDEAVDDDTIDLVVLDTVPDEEVEVDLTPYRRQRIYPNDHRTNILRHTWFSLVLYIFIPLIFQYASAKALGFFATYSAQLAVPVFVSHCCPHKASLPAVSPQKSMFKISFWSRNAFEMSQLVFSIIICGRPHPAEVGSGVPATISDGTRPGSQLQTLICSSVLSIATG